MNKFYVYCGKCPSRIFAFCVTDLDELPGGFGEVTGLSPKTTEYVRTVGPTNNVEHIDVVTRNYKFDVVRYEGGNKWHDGRWEDMETFHNICGRIMPRLKPSALRSCCDDYVRPECVYEWSHLAVYECAGHHVFVGFIGDTAAKLAELSDEKLYTTYYDRGPTCAGGGVSHEKFSIGEANGELGKYSDAELEAELSRRRIARM